MLKKLAQVVVMAAIVATLAYLPAGLILALAAGALGVSFQSLLTFGGAFPEVLALLLWWLLALIPAVVYTIWLFPWSEDVLAWPGRK